jgi:hypothetical protein
MDAHEDRTGAHWSIAGPQSIEVPGVERLRIVVARGEIDVIGRDEPGARIDVHEIGGPPLSIRDDDGVLRIGGVEGAGTQASITVLVQRDAAVEVQVVSAEVLVSGMKNGLRIGTVSGDVVCDATAGPARLEGTSGELALREHEGAVEVTTVSGALTVSGSVTRFECDGVSADLFLDLEVPDRVQARTVSGEVLLRLGPDRPAAYAIRTISGSVEVDGVHVGGGRSGYRGGWGAPGAEPVQVQLDSASGTVRIVHAGAA